MKILKLACLFMLVSFSAHTQGLTDFLFSVEDEIKLGKQVADEVEKDPKNKVSTTAVFCLVAGKEARCSRSNSLLN